MILQPAVSPYNVIERIHDANINLLESNSYRIAERQAKVKFKEELESYEQDSTDEDINSFESEKCEGEIVEELKSESIEEIQIIKHTPKLDKEIDNLLNIEQIGNSITHLSNKKSSKRIKGNTLKYDFFNQREIQCKDHCIERLDADFYESIKKLEIREKIDLPPLQLIQRKCCDHLNKEIKKNLPSYKGLRSEYGLTSRQINKKEKQDALIKLREQVHQQLLEEYRYLRIQQNEKMFIQWLKDVNKRNKPRGSSNNTNRKQNGLGTPQKSTSSLLKILSNLVLRGGYTYRRHRTHNHSLNRCQLFRRELNPPDEATDVTLRCPSWLARVRDPMVGSPQWRLYHQQQAVSSTKFQAISILSITGFQQPQQYKCNRIKTKHHSECTILTYIIIPTDSFSFPYPLWPIRGPIATEHLTEYVDYATNFNWGHGGSAVYGAQWRMITPQKFLSQSNFVAGPRKEGKARQRELTRRKKNVKAVKRKVVDDAESTDNEDEYGVHSDDLSDVENEESIYEQSFHWLPAKKLENDEGFSYACGA
ncbi:hypothetical protein NQ317_017856 [Molorchus minor]|uniref:Uncharacterized protein n=1 Tax=Molorchus minor TaxID=1323400 RepID=A0ABQ9K2D6_9CUCU|nr:hypothetical protein NQ317_017856 [Molorchus minor]